MKTIYRLLGILMLGTLTQAMSCEEGYDEDTYMMSEDRVPLVPYLTTISSNYFRQHVVNQGWRWKEAQRINTEGIASRYVVTAQSDFIPYDLYFGPDSITLFLYKENQNERRTNSYTYNATNNQISSMAVLYMQLIDADSTHISLIERHRDYYYRSYYERMLPYELKARWNGSEPEKQ
jgi:hypothetical protein